jgi:hypothetical protein
MELDFENSEAKFVPAARSSQCSGQKLEKSACAIEVA